jgi:hypothetical protein
VVRASQGLYLPAPITSTRAIHRIGHEPNYRVSLTGISCRIGPGISDDATQLWQRPTEIVVAIQVSVHRNCGTEGDQQSRRTTLPSANRQHTNPDDSQLGPRAGAGQRPQHYPRRKRQPVNWFRRRNRGSSTRSSIKY